MHNSKNILEATGLYAPYRRIVLCVNLNKAFVNSRWAEFLIYFQQIKEEEIKELQYLKLATSTKR